MTEKSVGKRIEFQSDLFLLLLQGSSFKSFNWRERGKYGTVAEKRQEIGRETTPDSLVESRERNEKKESDHRNKKMIC